MPRMGEREMFVQQGHLHAGRVFLSGQPIKFSDGELPAMVCAALLGAHTRARS